jgi:hypothetical protein
MSQHDPLIVALIGQVEREQISARFRVAVTLRGRMVTGRILRASEYRERVTKLAVGQTGVGLAVVGDQLRPEIRDGVSKAIGEALEKSSSDYLHLLTGEDALERIRLDQIESFGTHLVSS